MGKTTPIVYRALYARMILRGVSVRGLADRIGISLMAMERKMRWKSRFWLDECIRIKEALEAEEPIEALFQKEGEGK
jgi:hypothetical protein